MCLSQTREARNCKQYISAASKAMPSNSVPISRQELRQLLAEPEQVRRLYSDTFTKNYLRSTVSHYALRRGEQPNAFKNLLALKPELYTNCWSFQTQETKLSSLTAVTTTMPRISSSPTSLSDAALSLLTNRLSLSTNRLWWDRSYMDTLSQHFKRSEESSDSSEITTSFYPSKKAIRHSELYFRSFQF